MNIDKLKEELHKLKNTINNNLTEHEEAELDIFISNLVLDLQNKIKKINFENLESSMKQYIDEIENG